jgi:NarL family two-component system response regulator LiaR
MTPEITIVIADDHSVVRQGVRTLLETESDFKIVGEAATGEEAVKLCREMFPDVVLLDLLMPGIGGVEATAQIKEASPVSSVVVLTSYHDDEYILPAIKSGALSYLLKDVSATE